MLLLLLLKFPPALAYAPTLLYLGGIAARYDSTDALSSMKLC
jgi:hypothetical protein